ncbi:EpsG family protein [Paraburkholderia sp.]|uniref:EpsG family protein n=1 Tax=Paraburkholderia sp. TaxID=1926495 RepID=UPI002389E106|nr:EpsG family protein [Paraburkholderia sp.]MDE1180167.1 EpsG family protein [Paraburkholderia sp.]
MRTLTVGNATLPVPVPFAVALVVTVGLGLAFPFGAFYLYLLLVCVMGCMHRPGRFSVALLCIGAVVVLGPLVALKLPIQDGGNDKLQYFDFMQTMHAVGISQYMARQPEILSFSSLYIASALGGITDLAFLLLFVVYFSALLVAIWRERYDAIPLFLVLLISSSSFFGTYGNVIRQAMAFPFIFLMIFSKTRLRSTLFAMVAGAAHIPSLIICVPYLLYRYIGKRAIWAASGVAALVFVASKANPNLLASFGNDDSYLSTKLNIYSNWDAFSVAGVATLAAGIFALSNVLWIRSAKTRQLAGAHAYRAAHACLVTLNFGALALIATYNFAKVFERIYIYFFVVALMYLSLMIMQMRRGSTKALVLFVAVAYGVYGLAKNLGIQPLLYEGDPVGYLTASLLDMYRHFM